MTKLLRNDFIFIYNTLMNLNVSKCTKILYLKYSAKNLHFPNNLILFLVIYFIFLSKKKKL